MENAFSCLFQWQGATHVHSLSKKALPSRDMAQRHHKHNFAIATICAMQLRASLIDTKRPADQRQKRAAFTQACFPFSNGTAPRACPWHKGLAKPVACDCLSLETQAPRLVHPTNHVHYVYIWVIICVCVCCSFNGLTLPSTSSFELCKRIFG